MSRATGNKRQHDTVVGPAADISAAMLTQAGRSPPGQSVTTIRPARNVAIRLPSSSSCQERDV